MNSRILIMTALVASGCVTQKDLGDLASDTDAEDGSGVTTDVVGEETGETSSSDTVTDSATGPNPPMEGVGPAAVDILFVIDNSGSMGEEQGILQAGLQDLVNALTTTGLDYRVAVTTTDNGNYWCSGSGISPPESGNLVMSSCRSRLDDFVFVGDNVDASQVGCLDQCELESLTTTNLAPWIESADGSNLPDGVSVLDALLCAVPQGINGCGFESGLESMWKMLGRADNVGEDEFGFLREDAHLMVMLLSDEVDCSGENEEIFKGDFDGGNEVFWSLPEEQMSPTSAVCWNAGVECTGGPGAYDDCAAQDYAVSGAPTADPNAAVLFPLSRYSDQLEALRARKAESHAQVFLFGIVGVPTDYPSTRTIEYRNEGSTDPDAFEIKFGINQGCSSATGEAVPPVRVRELFEDYALTDASPLHSICGEGYGSALTQMVAQVNSFVGLP